MTPVGNMKLIIFEYFTLSLSESTYLLMLLPVSIKVRCPMCSKFMHEHQFLDMVRDLGWVSVLVEFGTSAFKGWVIVRVGFLGYGLAVRCTKV